MSEKVALVTGCNKGIGFATLKKLSLTGVKIFACVRKIDEKFLSSLNKLKNKNLIPVEFDLDNKDQVKSAIAEIKSKTKSIDMLVNNVNNVVVNSPNIERRQLPAIPEQNVYTEIT